VLVWNFRLALQIQLELGEQRGGGELRLRAFRARFIDKLLMFSYFEVSRISRSLGRSPIACGCELDVRSSGGLISGPELLQVLARAEVCQLGGATSSPKASGPGWPRSGRLDSGGAT